MPAAAGTPHRKRTLLADPAARYGRHTYYRSGAISVAALLTAAVQDGRAVRLRWRAQDEKRRWDTTATGWPTGVLPAVQG